MERENNTMFAEERKQEILKIISKNESISVPELCSTFGVSPTTIRNDLRELEERKLILRTHGGAISISKMSLEPSPNVKKTKMHTQKIAIAKKAAEFVEDNDVIAITTGTTTYEFAQSLLKKKGLTIILHDIKFASFLETHSDFDIILLGGFLRKNFHYITNTDLGILSKINIDKAFITCNGVHAQRGVTTPDFSLASIVSNIISKAEEVFLLADSSKLGGISFAQVTPLSKVDILVVDSDINPPDLECFNTDEIEVVIAEI